MYLVAIAWFYVVLMMAVAEAVSSQGTVLGGVITFVLYGVLPLSIVLYVMGSPARRRARLAAERQADDEAGTAEPPPAADPTPAPQPAAATSAAAPDSRSLTARGQTGGLLASERKEV